MAGTTAEAHTFASARRPGTGPARVHWRRALALWCAGLLAFLMLAGCAAAARAATATVSGAVANGYARLVFTLPENVEAQVRLANGIVVVAFSQPVDISVQHLAVATPGYIGAARRDPDGRAVRLALSRKATINTMTAGERLFVDLLPDGWVGFPPSLPQEVVDELARRARGAEKHARARQQSARRGREINIRVRVATLPTFTRYVFELAQPTAVTTDRTRDGLILAFDAPLKFALADAKAASPAVIAALDAETGSDSATVRFMFNGKVDVRSFREDATFVVDIRPTGSPEGAAIGKEDVSPGWSIAGDVPLAAPPVAAPQRPPAQTEPQPALAANVTPVAQPSVPPAVPDKVDAPERGPNAPVVALARQQGDSLRLVFPFRERTAGAIFRRADTLWLVFDTPAPVELQRLLFDSQGVIREATVAPSGEGRAVRIKLDRSRLASAAVDGQAWVITLGGTVLERTAPLSIARTRSGQNRPVAIIPLHEAQRVHRLNDPDAGNGLMIVTAHAPARGFLKPQELVEFRALASTHGVSIEPFVDDLSVELTPQRVVISRPSGLELTPGATDGRGEPALSFRPAVLDAQSWGFDRQADFLDRRAALMHALGEAAENRRTAARLAIARFYLARDMFAEAKGMLDVAVAGEQDQERLATALVLRAIANVMMGRESLALKDLSTPVVGNQHAAPLWRGVALSRDGRFAEARPSFDHLEAAAEFPIELQRVAFHEAARCALEVGDLGDATRRLNELESIGVPYDLRPSVSILAGKLAERFNRADDALAAYRAAAGSHHQPAAAQGRLRVFVLRQTLKQVATDEAITELETIAASWRGDDTELEALQLLAQFYVEAGRYRDALQIMRVALSAHPRSQRTRRIQDEAASIFDSVFLGERGHALTPMEALALFYDFRTLTPVGRRGDEMIRRLAERLVTMDLLGPASELLQHQIDHRLQGVARAQVAAQAAMIYLMHRKASSALQALRATRMNELPAELRAQRLLLEARALSDSGRHDLALEIIQDMPGADVDRLRADIYWAARHWREAAEEIERLHGERWREPSPLDATERSDVLRAAIGYALAEDILGLDRFRQRYADKIADGPDARLFQVVTAPLASRTPEFAEVAKAAISIDTLKAFLRDLRERYPDAAPAASAPQAGRG